MTTFTIVTLLFAVSNMCLLALCVLNRKRIEDVEDKVNFMAELTSEDWK